MIVDYKLEGIEEILNTLTSIGDMSSSSSPLYKATQKTGRALAQDIKRAMPKKTFRAVRSVKERMVGRNLQLTYEIYSDEYHFSQTVLAYDQGTKQRRRIYKDKSKGQMFKSPKAARTGREQPRNFIKPILNKYGVIHASNIANEMSKL